MMTDYEIYDLLYSNFKDKFDDDNIVFTQKYMVGHQKIHICHLKVKKKIDAFDCLDFLNKLQEKYGFSSTKWSPFLFSTISTQTTIFACISLSVKMRKRNEEGEAFQIEHDLTDEYFLDNSHRNISFTHNACTDEFFYHIYVLKNSTLSPTKEFEVFRKLYKQCKLLVDGWFNFQ